MDDPSQLPVVLAKGAMVGGAGTGAAGYLSTNDIILIGGFLVAVGGFIVNWYYARKDDRRKELEHRLRLNLPVEPE